MVDGPYGFGVVGSSGVLACGAACWAVSCAVFIDLMNLSSGRDMLAASLWLCWFCAGFWLGIGTGVVVDGWAFVVWVLALVWACMRMGLMMFVSGRRGFDCCWGGAWHISLSIRDVTSCLRR